MRATILAQAFGGRDAVAVADPVSYPFVPPIFASPFHWLHTLGIIVSMACPRRRFTSGSAGRRVAQDYPQRSELIALRIASTCACGRPSMQDRKGTDAYETLVDPASDLLAL